MDSITYVRNGVTHHGPQPSGSRTFSTTLTVSDEGQTTIGYSAIDRSGNAADRRVAMSFTIDRS